MDYKKIEDLLEKYFEGTTSLTEETELRTYFTTTKYVPKQFLYAQTMFLSFQKAKNIGYVATKKKSIVYLRFGIVAASITLLLGIGYTQLQQENKTVYCYINGKPITDKNIAINQVVGTLNLVSQNIKRGTSELNYVSKFHKSTLLIKKHK